MGVRTQQSVGQDRRRNTTEYYTDGNTVRVVRTAPAQRPLRRAMTQEEKRRMVLRNIEAKQTASVSMNLPLTLLLVACVAATLFIGYSYLGLKSSLDAHSDTVKALEADLDKYRTQNDALERSIDTSLDLNHVYEVAVCELGMVPAGQNNIIQYDKTESEYVRQYEDIPAANW